MNFMDTVEMNEIFFGQIVFIMEFILINLETECYFAVWFNILDFFVFFY